MKFNIKLNGVSVSKDIPNTWPQVNWEQFTKLSRAGEDMAKIVSVFTDIDVETLKIAKIKDYDVLLSQLAFLANPMSQIVPSTILGYKVPKNMEEEAAARYGDIQEILQKFTDDKIENIKHYPLIVATYITPSPYNWKEAEKLALELEKAPCSEVMATGNFILMRLAASRNGMLKVSHLEDTPLNRLRQATLLWLNRLAFSIRYGIWKKSLRSLGGKYLNGH